MKKVKNTIVSTSKKRKPGEEGELKKPNKLKPLKEKEKKGWKNKLDEDEDDFELEDDLSLSDNGDEEMDDEYDDDGF